MSFKTVIYGHSRGYRTLALFSSVALVLSASLFLGRTPVNAVAAAGTVGFGVLSAYAWRRGLRTIDVLHIAEDGFILTDPAQAFGLIRYEEIEELRIYALHENPMIGIRLAEPDHIRRRGPAITRVLIKPVWRLRHYQIVTEISELNDQVAAIRSVAVRMGIPVRSELL
ncbi:MAG: hypothetical protein ACLFR8_02705 [Alkalispirochaeta sp.]